MSTGYNWEGIRQVRATLLCARHVPERLCGLLLGTLYQVLDLYFLPARRYASAGYRDRNVSVCLSVCRPSRAGIVSKRRKLAA